MTDPRVTELDYDAIRDRAEGARQEIREADLLEVDEWLDYYATHVPALLDRIEVLEPIVREILAVVGPRTNTHFCYPPTEPAQLAELREHACVALRDLA